MSVTGVPSVTPLHRSAEQSLSSASGGCSLGIEPRVKMSTTEIIADTTGDHGAHPAADGTAVAREVTNYDGTFEEAMECGLIEVPHPVVWTM